MPGADGLLDDEEDEWAEPTPSRREEEEERRSHSASSGLAARLEAAFAAEEKRKATEADAPGKPVQTGHVWVFGSAPNCVLHPQNSLLTVFSWTWTSSPITIS